MTRESGPIGDDELDGLFGHLQGRPLALAVSGGADSMALMHLIARWAARDHVKASWTKRWRRKRASEPEIFRGATDRNGLVAPSWLGGVDSFEALEGMDGPPHVVVLTVDHGLRRESAREAVFVAEEAGRLGLPCEILRWAGPKPATGIQEAARAARRDLMLDCLRAEASILIEMANKQNCELALDAERWLVLAHHQEDQAETVLMRLSRGSGLEGLAGMRPRSHATRGPTAERPTTFAAHVCRPLLNLPKARLVATLEAGGHGWVEDPSNEDERFERVRLRKVMAALGEVGLTAEKIALSARRLSDADDGFRALLGDRPEAARLTALLAEVPLASNWFASPYLAVRSLRHLLRGYGGASREAELAQVEGLVDSIWRQAERAEFTGVTLGGCKIEIVGERRDRIRIYREGSGEGLPVVPLQPGLLFEWDGGRFFVQVPDDFERGAALAALGLTGWTALKKAVPELASLGWPAAAVATLPAVCRDGTVVDVPVLDALLRQLDGEASQARAIWSAHAEHHERRVATSFQHATDL